MSGRILKYTQAYEPSYFAAHLNCKASCSVDPFAAFHIRLQFGVLQREIGINNMSLFSPDPTWRPHELTVFSRKCAIVEIEIDL